MSGARDALEKLRTAARFGYANTFPAGANYAQCHAAMMKQGDVVLAMSAAVDLLVAAEELAEKAAQCAEHLRTAMREAIDDTGAPNVQAAHHTAHLARKPAYITIGDPSKVPGQYWDTPPAKINNARLRADLQAGIKVESVSLTPSNERTLVVKARKDTTP